MDDQGSMPRKSFVQQPQIGVPRKFAVGSLLAITAVYCILFRILTVYDATWAGLILVPFFVTFVGIAQAVFFGGQHPRETVSVASGSTDRSD